LAVVDGNVARVLARLYRLVPPFDRPGSRTRDLARTLLDPARPGDHNQAMMELGATVCLPANPVCDRCPVAAHCRAHAEKATDRHPAPRPRPLPAEVRARMFLLRDDRGRLFLERGICPLLPHLWLPPVRPESPQVAWALPVRFRVRASSLREVGEADHSITRHRIRLRVFAGRIDPGSGRLPAAYRLATDDDLAGLGRSSIVEKALRAERAWLAAGSPA
jgi:A/G-specific adenine glycosylase